jgi:hypothetical protein
MANRVREHDLDRETIEREIDDLMRRSNLMRPEAATAVLRAHGVIVSDLQPTRALTDEERDRLGLGRSALDEVARRRRDRKPEAARARGAADG